MSLHDIMLLDELHLSLTTMIQDRMLTLRLVSKEFMTALESNSLININLRINDAGVAGLTADFLKKWHGKLHLHCTRPWDPKSKWFKEVSDALLFGRIRPLNLLGLSVCGNNLRQLVEKLLIVGPAIKQLEIDYHGDGSDLIAAAALFASLGHTLTVKISVQGIDHKGRQMASWLQLLLASNIRVESLSLWSVVNSSPLQCHRIAVASHA